MSDRDDDRPNLRLVGGGDDEEKPKRAKKSAGGGKTEKPAGPPPISAQLVNMVLRRYHLRRDERGNPYAIPKNGPHVARSLTAKGPGALINEIAAEYFRAKGKAASNNAMSEAKSILMGLAEDENRISIPLRVANMLERDSVWVNLGEGGVIEITPKGWRRVEKGPGAFLASKATLPLPMPAKAESGSLAGLRKLLNVKRDAWDFIVAWWITTFVTDISHVIPIITGEQGTAKTFATKFLMNTVDPSAGNLSNPPKDLKEFYVAANVSWTFALENMSYISPWLNDALCRIVTGAAHRDRELYTDDTAHIIDLRRCVLINGIDISGAAGDLAERSVNIRLERIRTDARRTESDLEAAFEKAHPRALSELFNILSEVLEVRKSGQHELKTLPRMADFAQWVHYVDIVRGTKALEFYLREKNANMGEVSEDHIVPIALRNFLVSQKGRLWRGTASDLLANLVCPVDRGGRDWPTNPTRLGGGLTRLAPGLRSAGWIIDRKRSNGQVIWTLKLPVTAGENHFGDPDDRGDVKGTRGPKRMG